MNFCYHLSISKQILLFNPINYFNKLANFKFFQKYLQEYQYLNFKSK